MSQTSTIGEVLQTLIDYRGKTPIKTSEGVPLITAKVIKAGRITSDRQEFIAEDAYDSWMRRGLPHTGDVLITTEAPLGEVAQVGPDARVALAQRVILLRPDPNKVDPQFFFHFLRSPTAQERLRRRASGTTVSGIRQPELRAVEIDLLPRRSQELVGAILDALDDLIENNRRRIVVLEEMAQAIYREWFVNFRYPGHEDATFVDSPLGPIPEGWGTLRFGELVDLVKKTVDPSEIVGGSVLVGLEHIPRRRLTLDSWEQADEVGSRKALFSKGEILFGKIRPYFHKVSLAPVDGYCSSDAMVFRPKPGLDALATLIAFSQEFVDLASATANGTKMPRANWDVLAAHEVPVPSQQLLDAFTAVFSTSMEQCTAMMFANKRLSSIRDLLLPKLVTGEIDVSELDLGVLAEGVS